MRSEPSETNTREDAAALARLPTPENVQKIGELVRSVESADLLRWLTKLLSTCGQPGIDVLVSLLDDFRIAPFAMGALRGSNDKRVWREIVDAKLRWLDYRRTHWRSKPRYFIDVLLPKWSPLPPAEEPGFVIFADAKYHFSLTLPERFGVIRRRRFKAGWGILFREKAATVKGKRRQVTGPMISIQVERQTATVTPQQFFAEAEPPADLVAGLEILHGRGLDAELEQAFAPATVNGLPAFRAILVSGPERALVYVLADGCLRYFVMAISLTRDWASLEPELENILNSFAIPN